MGQNTLRIASTVLSASQSVGQAHGFFFPIEAMLNWLQLITCVIPLLYILSAIRAIVLKGLGLRILRLQVIAPAVFWCGHHATGRQRFSNRLE